MKRVVTPTRVSQSRTAVAVHAGPLSERREVGGPRSTGSEHLSPMGRAETGTLREQRGRRALEQPVRLACQVRVSGDVEIEKRGVAPDSI